MDDAACKETFNGLVSLLENQGMGWIADQVSVQIRAGKILHLEGGTAEYLLPSKQFRARIKEQGKIILIQDYSIREQLSLLIDAIERVVKEAVLIEEEIIRFSKKHGLPGKAIFQGEEHDDIVLTEELVGHQKESIQYLQELLNELRGRMNADDKSA